MDIVQALKDAVLYLPEILGKMANENVDLGLGMDADNLMDIFAGCEICGLVVVGFLLVRKLWGHSHAPKPAEPTGDTDDHPTE